MPSVSIDGDGGLVAFQTDDTNLVPGTGHACTVTEPGAQPCPGIYVRDMRSGAMKLVNVSAAGSLANGFSELPVISTDGRYVAFISGASNLVPGDTNNSSDVFVVDLKTAAIRRVSVSTTGVQSDAAIYSVAISADGRYVAFNSPATTLATGKPDKKSIGVFRTDLQTGDTRLAGIYGVPYEDFFGALALSGNGRYVAFESRQLDAHGDFGIYVRDMQTGALRRVDTSAQGPGNASEPAMDATGRYLAFTFIATGPPPDGAAQNVEQVLVRDMDHGTTKVVSASDTGVPDGGSTPAVSADGHYIAFASGSMLLSPDNVAGWTELFVRGPLN
jgi:Tol biopolymer transport system component